MGNTHQKRQRPPMAGRRGEGSQRVLLFGKIEMFGGCPSVSAPDAYTVSKYAGNRKTEGL